VNASTDNLIVAMFAGADPGGNVNDYKATINWGDKSPVAIGLVASAGGGKFFAIGGHTYKAPRTYTVTVAIQDSGGSTFLASNTSVTVAAAAHMAVTVAAGSNASANVAAAATPTGTAATITAIPATPAVDLGTGALGDNEPPFSVHGLRGHKRVAPRKWAALWDSIIRSRRLERRREAERRQMR
jgi:hypothetical protein